MDSMQEQIECVRTDHSFPNFKNLLGDHSDLDPPDSMPNSEVKRISADGSVGFPHVRVGHRQALNIVTRTTCNNIFSVLI